MLIRPAQIVYLMSSTTNTHPMAAYCYLTQRLPLGCNFLTPSQMSDLLNGYGATVPVGYTLVEGFLHL